MNVSKYLHKTKITSTQILYLLELITLEISVLRAVLVPLVPTSDISVCIVFRFGQMTYWICFILWNSLSVFLPTKHILQDIGKCGHRFSSCYVMVHNDMQPLLFFIKIQYTEKPHKSHYQTRQRGTAIMFWLSLFLCSVFFPSVLHITNISSSSGRMIRFLLPLCFPLIFLLLSSQIVYLVTLKNKTSFYQCLKSRNWELSILLQK